MFRIKPEKVAGIVALSYLVLIPAAGAVAYLKIRQIDQDTTTLWEHSGLDPEKATPFLPAEKVRGFFRR